MGSIASQLQRLICNKHTREETQQKNAKGVKREHIVLVFNKYHDHGITILA